MDRRDPGAGLVHTMSYCLVASGVQLRDDDGVGSRGRGAGDMETGRRRRSVHVEAVVFVAYGLVSATRI